MKRLNRIVLVQFFLYDAYEFDIAGNTAILGGNGAGKTSLLDAIQIAMLGANESYLAYNTQAVGTHAGGRRKPRSTRDYCLGVIDVSGDKNDRKRNNSISYISLVFLDDQTGEELSIGACIRANFEESHHEVLGLYVLPGFGLRLEHHVETTPEGKMPLNWSEFAANMRQQFQKLGRTCHLGNQTTPYIEEMLHALQPKAKRINTREYMKIFKKSVLLRDIESIDSFVRDYVVEAQPVKLQKAKAQIELFRKLSLMVEEVRQQIHELGIIRDKYEDVHRLVIRSHSIRALKASYEIEQQQTNCTRVQRIIADLFRDRHLAKEACHLLTTQEVEAEALHQQAQTTFFSASGATEHSERLNRLALHESAIRKTATRIEKDVSRVSSVFQDFSALKILGDGRNPMREASQQLALHQNLLGQGVVGEGLRGVLTASLESLNIIRTHVSSAFGEASRELETAKEKLAQTKALLRGAEDDGARLTPQVATLRDRLASAGVKAVPVCTLVKVKQPEWQRAIETFLKNQRESFVVPAGQEEKALNFLRHLPKRDNAHMAQIVVPKHLAGQEWDDSDEGLVGNLLEGDHPLALSYLRAVLGRMRCVSTEEELVQHSRALTVDGMRSASFTGGRMLMLEDEELLLGMKLTSDEVTGLERQLSNDEKTVRDLASYYQGVEVLKQNIEGLGRIDDFRSRLIEELDMVADTQRLREDLASQISSIDLGEFEPLKQIMDSRHEALRAIREKLVDQRSRLRSSDDALKANLRNLSSARRQRNYVIQQQTLDLTGEYVDPIVEAGYRRDIDTEYAGKGFPEKITACENRIRRAESDKDAPLGEANDLFNRYLGAYTISLGEERDNWRSALEWVKRQLDRLESTELSQRQDEVRDAALAAEEAFRNDVAVRLREGIEQMHVSINTINKTLAASPPFSNGEKYEFVTPLVDDHLDLHNYIMQCSEGGGADLFVTQIASEKIMKLLNDADDPTAKGDNPLDDFRCMFRFDLRIKNGAGRDTLLSRRLGGIGSNGEHRAPFYVIAGAALAAAYRQEGGKQSSGAGLMLLDEAFNGMDLQNSLATARFLESIGLQLIMAAPEADYSKLAPCLQGAYEINRFDLNIYVDRTLYKPEAHRLLTSDMPSEHPDLVAQMVQTIEAEQA